MPPAPVPPYDPSLVEDYEQYALGEITYEEMMRRQGRLVTESFVSRFFRLLSLGLGLPGVR